MNSCVDNDLYSPFISMIESLNEPWGIKDIKSNHVYMNKSARIYTNTPSFLHIEGMKDYEFPAEWSELHEELQEHDRLAIQSLQQVTIIETHLWNGKSLIHPYISEKKPIYGKNKECLGVIWNAKELGALNPLKFVINKKKSTLITEPENTTFTKRELDVIFLSFQRLTSKEMARILKLSHKSIENKLNIIYQKAGVNTIKQLTEYCTHIGLDRYIPYSFLSKGIQFI